MKRAKPGESKRSKKAGRPPVEAASRPQVERRRKTARAAVKKDTMLLQTDAGTQVVWAGSQPKPQKRSSP